MTKNQIEKMTEMRERGTSYSNIANELNIPQNTVKSYCNRHNIRPLPKNAPVKGLRGETTSCEYCGELIIQNLKHAEDALPDREA